MSVRVRLIKNDFGKIAAQMESKARAANEETADAIAADAQIRAPVKEGDLRDSIEKKPDGDTNFVVEVGVPYGARIELGFNDTDSLGRTYNQAGQPYLTPAAEGQRDKHIQRVKKIVEP